MIINATAKDTYQLNGTNPDTVTLGREMDISNLQFGWYEWVYYHDDEPYPLPRDYLGRCLGPAKDGRQRDGSVDLEEEWTGRTSSHLAMLYSLRDGPL